MSGPQDRNISTEHQKEGDALKPSDTLDRGRTGGQTAEDVKDIPEDEVED